MKIEVDYEGCKTINRVETLHKMGEKVAFQNIVRQSIGHPQIVEVVKEELLVGQIEEIAFYADIMGGVKVSYTVRCSDYILSPFHLSPSQVIPFSEYERLAQSKYGAC